MKYLAIISVAFLFVGCATNKNKDYPTWIHNPQAKCSKRYFCTVGMGANIEQASANARNQMAKTFEVKITSSFSATESALDQKVSTDIHDFVNEEVDSAIKGIVIEKTHKQNKKYYAFAKLDKHKNALIYKVKMNELSGKIKGALGSERIGSLLQIDALLSEWNAYHDVYSFLTGMSIKAPVSESELEARKSRLSSSLSVYVQGASNVDNGLKSHFMDLLSQLNIDLVKSEKRSTHIVLLKLAKSKVFMKVEGFKKFKYNLVYKIRNRTSNEIATISLFSEQVARTERSCDNQASEYFKTELLNQSNKITFL